MSRKRRGMKNRRVVTQSKKILIRSMNEESVRVMIEISFTNLSMNTKMSTMGLLFLTKNSSSS